MRTPFGTETMAAGYARFRPPVHPRVIEILRERLRAAGRVRLAADIGCGAGLSTRALRQLADRCIGIDPVETMLERARSVDPWAVFVVGAAEAIPFRNSSIDLMSAAGSLNYVDLGRFFPEAARVLRPEGVLVVYDFSPGKSLRDTPRLDEWFQEFMRRYPQPPGEARALNPEILAELDSGFYVQSSEYFEIGLTLTPGFYLDYMMTETNVAAAVRQGAALEDIKRWCEDTLNPIWQCREQEVLFRGYWACMRRD